jgi:hypothetical protein
MQTNEKRCNTSSQEIGARPELVCANARDLKNDMATEIDEICDEMPQDLAGDLH